MRGKKEIVPEGLLMETAERYIALEREIRFVVDTIVAPVCSVCTRVCCQASYCRETLRNPWYRFLFEYFGNGQGVPWDRQNPPPGLGSEGCVIRSGRYAYCYAYNCRAICKSLGSTERIECFQQISDLLKDIGLHFAEKRHLTDIRTWKDITPERLERLGKKIEEGAVRFQRLCSLLFITKPG